MDIIVSKMNISLSTETNLQNQLAQHLQRLRKQQKLSRQALEKSALCQRPPSKSLKPPAKYRYASFCCFGSAWTT